MLLATIALVAGLALLVWSADRFVDGAAAVAYHGGMSPLLIGMVVIGFGTSAPEIVVSVLAAIEGNPGLALGNAFGSNISNIGLIIGLVALISPIRVHSQVIRKELPLLAVATLAAGAILIDHAIDRVDGSGLLLLFTLLMGWSIWQGLRNPNDPSSASEPPELAIRPALLWLLAGLLLLVISSRILVWGAVEIATALGVSDLIIGLTIVAIGTSLPELASSLAAVRKGEHDLALGNVIGSNLFNTLAVVGIATTIEPLAVEPVVLSRDWAVMAVMTLALFVTGHGFGRPGLINRWEGSALLTAYLLYTGYLVSLVVAAQ